jgi:hypothetical protein
VSATRAKVRRMWSELVPLAELARSEVLGVLASRGVQLLAAVLPGQIEEAIALVRRAAEIDLSIGLWPMLHDHEGRWLHPKNAARFEGWIFEVLDAIEGARTPIAALVLDLEPPIHYVRLAKEGRVGAMRELFGGDRGELPHRAIVGALGERGIASIAAVVPTVLCPGRAARGWERALGTPMDARYDAVAPMLYTSLFEGYTRSFLARRDARALLASLSLRARNRFGPRAAISLGAVGLGALGDERTYRDPDELADDVAIARAAGVDDLALFDLAGVLARPPIERWLDVFIDTEPLATLPRATLRSRSIYAAMSMTGLALDAFVEGRD